MTFSAQAYLRLTVAVQGLPGGSSGVDVSFPIAETQFSRQSVDLASGLNTITVPTGAQVCIFIPPTNNTQTITLKGVTGDTGIKLSPSMPTMIPLTTTSPSTSFALTTGGAIAGCEVIFL